MLAKAGAINAVRALFRSHLKNRILVQDQGGAEFQPADILKYFEELKLGPNAEVGTKDIFEIASNLIRSTDRILLPEHRFSLRETVFVF